MTTSYAIIDGTPAIDLVRHWIAAGKIKTQEMIKEEQRQEKRSPQAIEDSRRRRLEYRRNWMRKHRGKRTEEGR